MMVLTPVRARSVMRMPLTSRPEARRWATRAWPKGSEPTAAMRWTERGEGEEAEGRDRRCVATNWLAPLPPGPVVKEVAVRVSPGCGRRGVVVMRSVFREPITRMDMLRGVGDVVG